MPLTFVEISSCHFGLHGDVIDWLTWANMNFVVAMHATQAECLVFVRSVLMNINVCNWDLQIHVQSCIG